MSGLNNLFEQVTELGRVLLVAAMLVFSVMWWRTSDTRWHGLIAGGVAIMLVAAAALWQGPT